MEYFTAGLPFNVRVPVRPFHLPSVIAIWPRRGINEIVFISGVGAFSLCLLVCRYSDGAMMPGPEGLSRVIPPRWWSCRRGLRVRGAALKHHLVVSSLATGLYDGRNEGHGATLTQSAHPLSWLAPRPVHTAPRSYRPQTSVCRKRAARSLMVSDLIKSSSCKWDPTWRGASKETPRSVYGFICSVPEICLQRECCSHRNTMVTALDFPFKWLSWTRVYMCQCIYFVFLILDKKYL